MLEIIKNVEDLVKYIEAGLNFEFLTVEEAKNLFRSAVLGN